MTERTPEKRGEPTGTPRHRWSFDDPVASGFEEHARCSIPLYELGHELIVELSDYFVSSEDVLYDLGCSTGLLAAKLALRHARDAQTRVVGIDRNRDMVDKARKAAAQFPNLTIKHSNIQAFTFEPSSFVVSYYTLQFISPSERAHVLAKIYDSLIPGGAFVLFEKVLGRDPFHQDLTSQLYAKFKLEMGLSPEHIVSKSAQLAGILRPLTSEQNHRLLREAGFQQIWPMAAYLQFEGTLAIK